ncbi:MAG: LysM peptidoglycan-binding domain-containing M23 family metallopeptidase [Kiloniellales bacterium]|nr:LysM peptidoglycan-binding domain-containing M23 family metallopeptidase [Kiloniellales bacterium]
MTAVLAAAALYGCAIPLNEEDLAAYKERQAARSGAVATADQTEPRPAVGAVGRSGASSAPVETVDRTPLEARGGTRLDPVPAAKPGDGSVHVVSAGDTVYAISRKFGVPPKKIIAHNDLAAPYTLSIGQEIKIPGRAQPGQSQGRHVVAKGDTVYGIARRHGVPLRALIDANRLPPPYTLVIGQALVVPTVRQHRVSKGETVYSIARRYDVDLRELVRLNGIDPPYTIRPAESLVLPGRRPDPKVAAVRSAAATGQNRTARAARPSPPPAAIPKPPPRARSTFLWPVSGTVILGYGPKKDGRHNDGINISAPRGTPVRAAENGVVAYAGNELRGFGNLVLVKHQGGWVTAYAHTEQIEVRRGDTVKRGQTIGRVGSTGSVAEPQLHFELRKGTRAVNPTKLLGPKTADRN